jgi:hypothetical protein
MSKRKVTFSLEEKVVETLRMMSALASKEQSSIVMEALEDYFAKLASRSGKTVSEFMVFMKEAGDIATALRPDSEGPVQHSQLPSDVGLSGTHSKLPGDE